MKKGFVTETLLYSALGQMVETSGGAAGTVLFMYDESGHLLGEYSSTGALIQETIWLGDIPVATLRPSGSTVLVYYIEADHLNTPRQVTRASDNKQMWTWFSDPFGTTAPNSNPAGAGTFTYNLRFPGQIFDGQAGLHQNVFRDYDPAIGRYVESDPIGLRGSTNTYTYVSNKPIKRVDPNGLLDCDGTWNFAGWNPLLPRITRGCACYWLCTPCLGSVAWSGIKESLPSTTGQIIYDPANKPSNDGGVDEGTSCACKKPGSEKSCVCFKPRT